MKLATLGLILGLTTAFNSSWDFNYNRCDGMLDPECVKFALKEYNYTVPEIRKMTTVMRMITERRVACKLAGHCPTQESSKVGIPEKCANGRAGGQYECSNIDMLAFISLRDLGSGSSADGNDIWGWTDPNDPTGIERRYAITGQTDGSTIVDVTDPVDPVPLCYIKSKTSLNTVWRDIKIVYNDEGTAFAAIVADRSGSGLQWVPLRRVITKCRANGGLLTLTEGNDYGWIGSGVYTGGTNTHNIVGSDGDLKNGNVFSTGKRVYLVGSNSCSGGLLAVNFASVGTEANNVLPQPSFGGCFSSDGYTHDAECFTYNGPDSTYLGREICIGYNENSITIVDYTDVTRPVMISRTTYGTSAYTHQGWRTTDQRYILMNDELDESRGRVSSQTTYVVDITRLSAPVLRSWPSGIQTIDHNLYIKQFCDREGDCDDYVFEANYRAGLRVLKVNAGASNINNALEEVGYFKTWTGNLAVSFNGAWSSYPYFNDNNNPGLVVVQDIEQGLFVLDVCNAIDQCNDRR